ncbi:hypothetical protein E4U55_007874 [Claviceps digitariae]|nr:hypothetical protein E4U55_007874 [Claviceps digitariae]
MFGIMSLFAPVVCISGLKLPNDLTFGGLVSRTKPRDVIIDIEILSQQHRLESAGEASQSTLYFAARTNRRILRAFLEFYLESNNIAAFRMEPVSLNPTTQGQIATIVDKWRLCKRHDGNWSFPAMSRRARYRYTPSEEYFLGVSEEALDYFNIGNLRRAIDVNVSAYSYARSLVPTERRVDLIQCLRRALRMVVNLRERGELESQADVALFQRVFELCEDIVPLYVDSEPQENAPERVLMMQRMAMAVKIEDIASAHKALYWALLALELANSGPQCRSLSFNLEHLVISFIHQVEHNRTPALVLPLPAASECKICHGQEPQWSMSSVIKQHTSIFPCPGYHSFHTRCIVPWMYKYQRPCPTCYPAGSPPTQGGIEQ